MRSWIAIILALGAGAGVGWFLGYAAGRKRGAQETQDKIVFEESGQVTDVETMPQIY